MILQFENKKYFKKRENEKSLTFGLDYENKWK